MLPITAIMGLPMLRIVIPKSSPYPKPFKQQTSGLPMLRIVIPNSSPYPKPFKQQTSGLPMLRIVIPKSSPYPKPFKQQTSGLPMLRIVIPKSSPYPKPFKQFAMRIVWLFCFSSVYESELSTQPQNKKASHLRERLCSETGI
jgi:hypothetical protein